MITNNVSIQYSVPSVDDNIDTEMMDVIDAATRTDEEKHCLLSDNNDDYSYGVQCSLLFIPDNNLNCMLTNSFYKYSDLVCAYFLLLLLCYL